MRFKLDMMGIYIWRVTIFTVTRKIIFCTCVKCIYIALSDSLMIWLENVVKILILPSEVKCPSNYFISIFIPFIFPLIIMVIAQ